MAEQVKTQRIESIDIFRAFTMLAMLFVNDFAGMKDIPHWLEHAKTREDMMGFSDLVFPAFLFCVGLSIPFAVANRIKKGDSSLQVIWHVLSRSVILLIMGIFSMNLGGITGVISANNLAMIAVIAYFFLWNAYPKAEGTRKHIYTALKIIGAILLIGIVFAKDWYGMSFRHGWWGILGLIGWCYGLCALAYIFLKGDFKKIRIAWIAAIVLMIVNQLPFIPREFGIRALFFSFFPGGWTQAALVLSGMFGSLCMLKYADKEKPGKFLLNMLIAGALMCVLAIICHNFWIISKNMATPTWFFFCVALYYPILGLLYYFCDAKGKTSWAKIVKPAGVATLTAYMMPNIWYGVMNLLGLNYPAALTHGGFGLLRSFCFALCIIGITWCLGKLKIKLKI